MGKASCEPDVHTIFCFSHKLHMQCLFSKNGTQSTYRRLALEPVALSLIKDTFQLTPFIAVLLNVLKDNVERFVSKYTEYANFWQTDPHCTCKSCTKDNAKVRLQVHEAVPKRQFFLEDYGIFHRGLLITNNIIIM